jgi:hypothetical protein
MVVKRILLVWLVISVAAFLACVITLGAPPAG